MKNMLRYEIPIDSQPHSLRLGGDPISVDTSVGNVNMLDLWAERDIAAYSVMYTLQVFGTGEPVPYGARWLASTGRTRNGDVWHLYDMTEPRGNFHPRPAGSGVLTDSTVAMQGRSLPQDSGAVQQYRAAVADAIACYPGDVGADTEDLAKWIADKTLWGQ